MMNIRQRRVTYQQFQELQFDDDDDDHYHRDMSKLHAAKTNYFDVFREHYLFGRIFSLSLSLSTPILFNRSYVLSRLEFLFR